MIRTPSLVFLHLTLSLSCVLGCTPAPRSVSSSQEPATAQGQPEEGQAETISKRTTPAVEAAIDRDTCGLPGSIRQESWPTTLAPMSSDDPKPPAPTTVTLAVLPDTQYYASCRELHMKNQTAYVARIAKDRTVAATLFLGDLTEHNTWAEWDYVQDALDRLPPSVPTILSTGNHDYGTGGSADRRSTLFNQALRAPSPTTQAAILTRMESNSLENVLYRFAAGPFHLSVLVLEWSPRDRTVAWAKEALSRFPDERLIFITHAYMYHDDTRYNWQARGEEQEWNPIAYGTAKIDPKSPPSAANRHPDGAWDGEMLWRQLLADYPGLFLTLSGHVLGDGTGYLESRGTSGNSVHQVLTNFQMLDEGGLGYLRLIEIAEDGVKLTMKTYSPSLEKYATARDQNYTVDIDPPLVRRSPAAGKSAGGKSASD